VKILITFALYSVKTQYCRHIISFFDLLIYYIYKCACR